MDSETAILVRRIATAVRMRYILADHAEPMATLIETRLAEGAYAGLSLADLCAAVQADLRSVHDDQHLRLLYRSQPRPAWDGDEWSNQASEDPTAMGLLRNHGVTRAERLAGNVGYLDLRSIDDPQYTAATITAALVLLQHTHAMLLDLRHNDGGSPAGVAFLCSFFFPPSPVHVNDVYSREQDSTQQFWTYAHVPGPRYLDRPVYVLTSGFTFSGAEEIAYNLQQLGRASVVGETTRGGAHPFGHFWMHPNVSMWLPVKRSINPVSGTNWEGVGVRPDVPVTAEQALPEAYARALRDVMAKLAGESGQSERTLTREARRALESPPHATPSI